MTLNNFIEAIAGKLAGVWPDRKVYVDEIPKDADGQFFVGIIESGQEAHLDRRRKRSIQIEVLYFLKSKENMEFNAWAEEMYDQFETLTVKETDQKTRTIRLTNQRARPDKNARVYQFTFDADFFFVLTPAESPSWKTWDKRRKSNNGNRKEEGPGRRPGGGTDLHKGTTGQIENPEPSP